MASIKILLRDKATKEGLFPIVLKIIKDRKPKVISLGMECLKKDWDEANSQFKKNHPNYIQRNRVLLKLKEKALKVIDGFNIEEVDFTLTQFEDSFRGKKDSNISVRLFWEDKIADLNKAGRTGNARAYLDTMNSFFKFAKNFQLKFRDINVEMLDKYETHLRATGSKDGGIGVRMRELRALYNDAIKRGIVDEKLYPFKTYKVSKLKGSGIKKALTKSEIKKIIDFDELKHPHLAESKKLFLFSYFTSGMNFFDIMKLRWSNIQNGRIVYTRSKTKGNFSVKILEPVRIILDEFKNQNITTDYVFPILLKEGLTPIQVENRKAKKLKQFNRDLKKIAEIQGIESKVTSYVARHSYATNLKESGVSTDMISQSMGHQNVGITTAYLKDFDNNIIDDANEKLLQEPIPIYNLTNELRLAL
ncbi:site-specific integrase [Flavobacterium psychrophilum]|uniref:site-specific integrase n=1 Tax=Flavobacterium psychrophilum TaxID=96345 RepID=UPI00106973B7|nr:site-specific integrase [Flavobacterium psychrophilum]